MKNLYRKEDHRYTPEAMKISSQATEALKPIFDRFIALGYSPREISHIMFYAVFDLELEAIL